MSPAKKEARRQRAMWFEQQHKRAQLHHCHGWLQTHPLIHNFIHRGEWAFHCLYLGVLFVEGWGKAYALCGGALLVFVVLNTLAGDE